MVEYNVVGGKLWFDEMTQTIMGCDRNVTRAEIPPYINEIEVRHIGKYAFNDCTELEKVVIPESVCSIGDGAFCNCFSLDSVRIPSAVRVIEGMTFKNCYELTEVKLENGVREIKEEAFVLCCKLNTIKIPESVKYISTDAFYLCDNLKYINVSRENRVYSSYEGVLYDKSQKRLIKCPIMAENINIPESVTRICTGAFSDCRCIKKISLPKRVRVLEGFAFDSCHKLKKIIVPRNARRIDYPAFLFDETAETTVCVKRFSSAHLYAVCAHLKYAFY